MSNSAPTVDRIRIIPRPDDFLDRNVGSSGEVFFNRATSSLRIYNGKDRGGFEVARADLSNVDTSTFVRTTNLDTILASKSIETFSDVMYMPGPPEEGQVLVWRTDHWMNETLELSSGTRVDVSGTPPTSPQSGNLWLDTNSGRLYIYVTDQDSSQWIQPSAVASGGTATDAITLQGQPGSYYLNYNNFSNRPTSILNFGITDGTAGQVLSTNGNGTFSFVSVSGGGGGSIDLTALSVTSQSPSGNGSLTYNNLTGVFTFTPPNLSTYLTAEADTLSSVTARGASTNSAITINNTLTVSDLQTSGAGTPEISSPSTVRLTAPDGIVMANQLRLASYTTTQRNALTPVNGDIIYNNSTNKFQGYANGVWVDLH